MRQDLAQAYNDFLTVAAEAVKRGDKHAAMFCLKHAMRAANAAHLPHASSHYRSKVMRAMNYVRAI